MLPSAQIETAGETNRSRWDHARVRLLKATELAQAVLELIDEKPTRNADGSLKFSRQRVSAFLNKHAGTRVGGYALIKGQTTDSYGKEVSAYNLQRSSIGACAEK